jgi:endonuclease/exonuclease/phosphatase (EEP) superfamily protein YafD
MKFVRLAIYALLFILGIVLLAVTMVPFAPVENYAVDTLAQLRLCWLVAAAALLSIALFLRRRITAVISVVALVVNGVICGSLYLPQRPATASNTIKVVAANIWGAHQERYDDLVALVDREQPDVFVVIEYTRAWLKELHNRLPQYPYQFEEGLSGGAAVFSKIPIEQIETKTPRRYGVRGWLNIGNQKVLFIASHPPAPSRLSTYRVRNRELERLADDVKQRTTPVIITGDLNCTPWSSHFQKLVNDSGLLDSQQGHGPLPSWSTRHFLLVPIDHALYTSDLVVTDRRTGPNIGSDHLPIIFSIGPKTQNP